MKMLLLLLLLLLSACATATPVAPNVLYVHREGRDGLRPRCLALDNGLNLFLRWNEADRYSRVIEATRDERPCSQWRTVLKERAAGFVVVEPEQWVFGFPLPADVQRDLADVRRGAHDLGAPPAVSSFDLASNTALTYRYGHGPAGAVYAALKNADEKNQQARAALLADMTALLAAGEDGAAARMKELGDVHVLVSMGLGWDETVDEHTVGYVKTFIETVQSIGVPVEVLERNTFGGLEENATLLQATVEKHLAAGHDLVLFGLCKGSPELLAAASAALAADLDDKKQQKPRPGRGKVRGVVNMSGMLSGILFSDWIAPFEGPLTVGGTVLAALPLRDLQETGRYMIVLPQLSTPKVEAFKQRFVDKLPSDAVYLDVVGVVPGNGLLVRDVGAMGPFIQQDRAGDLAKAANDGFVRYPGNELPAAVSPQHTVVVVDGSHMLFDGPFGAYSLEDPKNQRALFQAAVRYVLQHSDSVDSSVDEGAR